jgi:hypothetical protein
MSPARRTADNQNEQKKSARPSPKREMPTPTAAAARIQRLPAGPASPAELLALQGRVGNRAVQSLLATRQVQAKLEVGAADDPFEEQANAAADSVMRAPSSDEEPPVGGQLEEE